MSTAPSTRRDWSLTCASSVPPPSCVSTVCGLLAPGGHAVLHAPYHIPNHTFRDEAVMQMNYVPIAQMRAAIEQSGCVLVHAATDVDRCGDGILNCMYVVRRGAA